MGSQPEPHKLIDDPPIVISHRPPKRAYSKFHPAAEGAASSSQPDQSKPGAEPGNDSPIDGAPGQNRNGGGKVGNLKSPLRSTDADTVTPRRPRADTSGLAFPSARTLHDKVSAFTDSPAIQETHTTFYSLFCD